MAFDSDDEEIELGPPGEPPAYVLVWRCPHCGQGAVKYEYRVTNDGLDPQGDVRLGVTNIFTCANGHVRLVTGPYLRSAEL